MEIRKMRDADVEQVRRIYTYYILNSTATFDLQEPAEHAFAERMKPIIAAGLAWVYVSDGILSGYCYAHSWKEKEAFAATLETTVYVHPRYQGQRIGYQLMLRLIREARKKQVHSLVACITSPNPFSERLHRKLGFAEVSHFREVGYKFGMLLDVKDFQLIL